MDEWPCQRLSCPGRLDAATLRFDEAMQHCAEKPCAYRIPATALSVRQPWAWALIHGGKDIENRSIPAVKHGMKPGRIALHAAKGMTREEYEDARHFMLSIGVDCPRPDNLVRGAIIGVVTVTDIVSESDSPWFFGPRGLVCADPVERGPIPATGALGYFTWIDDVEEESLGTKGVEEPKPWMVTWPHDRRRTAQTAAATPDEPAPMPLFETSGNCTGEE